MPAETEIFLAFCVAVAAEHGEWGRKEKKTNKKNTVATDGERS